MVKDIVYIQEFQQQAVMDHFDNYQGPFLTERFLVIETISKSLKEVIALDPRTLLHLKINYAVTTYNCQVLKIVLLTGLSKIALEIGPQASSLIANYIEFSTVCKFETSFPKDGFYN